jgi:signal transduction histidine kinase
MSEPTAPPPDAWYGLWPASARADRGGWLLRELAALALPVVAALASIGIAANQRSEGMELNVVSVLLLGLAVAAVPFRHRYPAAALGVAFVATLLYTSFFAEGPVYFPLIVTFGQVVLLGRRRVAVVVLVAGFLLFPWLGVVLGDDDAPPVGHVVALGAWLSFLLSLTEVIRARRDRAREEARSQAEALRRRATEERLRIARELHDVVAHNMSLISIQAGVALHLMDQRPEQARESLTTIKQASKEALVELRSILGVLRQVDESDESDEADGGDEDGRGDRDATDPGAGAPRAPAGTAAAEADQLERAAPRSPVPTLQRLDELVERARAIGVEVRMECDLDLGTLPRDVDLAAYRIIQESLTNVARHSDDKTAEVRVHAEDGVLSVDVLDEGTLAWQRVIRQPGRPAPHGLGSGHGLAGMRERAASVGGTLEAGPRPGRGFAVRARLPMPRRMSAESEEPE